jgi:hypothetical protein
MCKDAPNGKIPCFKLEYLHRLFHKEPESRLTHMYCFHRGVHFLDVSVLENLPFENSADNAHHSEDDIPLPVTVTA